MKSIKNSLLLTGLFALITTFWGLPVRAGQLTITGQSGNLFTAEPGQAVGIEVNWVYDIYRIARNDTFYVGMAIVQQAEPQFCRLIPFTTSSLQPQPKDILIKNDVLTQRLAATQSAAFWDEIQQRHAGSGGLDFTDGRLFRHCKIRLKNGDQLKVKNLIVKTQAGVLIPKRYASERELIPLEQIQSIRTPTGNYALVGAILGAAIGGAVILLHEEKTRLDTVYVPAYQYNEAGKVIGMTPVPKIVKKSNKFSLDTRIGLIGGGYLLGSIIGSTFKSLWREIYSAETPVGTISVDWNIPPSRSAAIGVNVNIKF